MSDPPIDPAIDPSGMAPAPTRVRDRRAAALIGALTLLLGFAIAVQVSSNSKQDALAGARQDDLVAILDDQNSQAARLRTRIADLQAVLQRLREAGTGDAAARDEAQRQADALGILTGSLPATGPGVEVTIADPAGALKAEGLLDVVEELRGSGAEAIQFGPVRVGVSSAFTDSATVVSLDGVVLTRPYVVQAIGPAKTMDTALNIPGGVAATVRTAGGNVFVRQRVRVDITVLRALRPNRYATPAPR